MEGYLKIVSLKEVELADENATTTPKPYAQNYGEYPLIVRSRDGKKEGRAPKRVWAKPQPFTVVSNRTVRVDMDIDTGIR